MLSEAAQVAATRRYQAQLATIIDVAAVIALVGFAGLDSYDEDDVDTFRTTTEPRLKVAGERAVALAAGFYALTATTRPSAAPVAVEMAWRDPFIAVWSGLKHGEQYEDAVTAGLSRAEAEASNYVVSSSRQAGDNLPEANIVGWRRVLSSPSCEWCQTVSTQRYRTAESADFGHERCDCTVAPIYGESDPGRVINRELLTELKQSGATDRLAAAKAARRARELTRQLGEVTNPAQRRKIEQRVAAYQRRAVTLRERATAAA